MERREFLRRTGAVTAGFALLRFPWNSPAAAVGVVPGIGPYGLLQPPNVDGLQLPAGFMSRVVAQSGKLVAGSTYTWRPAPDGSACFPRPDGGWVLVSNSEVTATGGVGALRFDAAGAVVDGYSILSNTSRNCAGGTTPWGTWLSAEEVDAGHVWECDPQQPGQGVRRPLLGTFKHEAAAVDPATGIVYLTEDQINGRFYRFIPAAPGDLSAGRLQAASLTGTSVNWFDVSTTVPERSAATTAFARGEGMWVGDGVVYFSTTADSRIWEYTFATEQLVVFYNALTDLSLPLRWPDNLTIHSLSGDMYVAEDGDNMELCLIAAMGAERHCVPFVRWVGHSSSEVSGVTFNPDGTRMYVNSQRGTTGAGITYEITGPFRRSTPPPPVTDALIAAGSIWKYLDRGEDGGTAWRGLFVNDSAWASGAAPLGYGDPVATTVGFGPDPNNKHVTTYFRRTFTVEHGYTTFLLRLRRDDGAIVYINGEEVARSNLPRGDVGYRTPAVNAVVGAEELAFIDFAISPRLYRGPNVVAVEIHQQNPISSDMVFDLALLGTGNAGPLPEPQLPPISMINAGAEASAPAVRIP